MAHIPLRVAGLTLLMIVTVVAVRVSNSARTTGGRQPQWELVPYQLTAWHGEQASFDPVYGFDPATSSMLRIYRKKDELPVIVYAGFHSDLTAILDFHVPTNCYPAQGWRIVSEGKLSPGNYRGVPLEADEISVDKQGNRRLVVWWFLSSGKPFQYRMRYVFELLATSTFSGRTDGAIVRLETPLETQGEASAAAEQRVRDLSANLLPTLEKAFPE